MEQQDNFRGRLVAAAAAVLVLNLAGVVWLGFSQEMLRAEIAALGHSVRETPAPAPAGPPPADPSRELAALREALARVAAKVDALAATDEGKAVARLTLEVKNLANRVEALAAAKNAPARETKPAAPRVRDDEAPPRPFFGPGYPAWPGY